MNDLTRFAAGALLAIAPALAQDNQNSGTIAEAVKQAKLTLVDAAHKANAVLSGAIVHATLQPAKGRAPATYDVHVLHEGRLFAIAIDAVSGAVGKPVQLWAASSKTLIDFETVAIGTLPDGWRAAETASAGQPGKWRIEAAAGTASGKRVLRLLETKNGGETFNLVLSDAMYPADLDLAVGLHADAGDEDRGGGLIWRAKDADNYYVVRWNPLEANLRAYVVEDGLRSMLKSIDVTADATQWHTLRVSATGKSFAVFFDGKPLLAFDDDTFVQAGRVGVWTKADAASSFDDLQVEGR